MKSFRIIAVAAATLFFVGLANAQIQKGSSSLGLYGTYQKPEDGDASGAAFMNYGYFMSDSVSLNLGAGAFFGDGTVGFGSLDVSYYFAREKTAPYIGIGASYLSGDGISYGSYRGFIGCEFFVSEKTSFDTKVVYEKGFKSGDGSQIRAEFGYKIYWD